jgi:hypothetical protein
VEREGPGAFETPACEAAPARLQAHAAAQPGLTRCKQYPSSRRAPALRVHPQVALAGRVAQAVGDRRRLALHHDGRLPRQRGAVAQQPKHHVGAVVGEGEAGGAGTGVCVCVCVCVRGRRSGQLPAVWGRGIRAAALAAPAPGPRCRPVLTRRRWRRSSGSRGCRQTRGATRAAPCASRRSPRGTPRPAPRGGGRERGARARVRTLLGLAPPLHTRLPTLPVPPPPPRPLDAHQVVGQRRRDARHRDRDWLALAAEARHVGRELRGCC